MQVLAAICCVARTMAFPVARLQYQPEQCPGCPRSVFVAEIDFFLFKEKKEKGFLCEA
jgi:hypothetical protein